MEELKVHEILWEFKNKKKRYRNRKFLVFIAKVSLLTAKFETSFQSLRINYFLFIADFLSSSW